MIELTLNWHMRCTNGEGYSVKESPKQTSRVSTYSNVWFTSTKLLNGCRSEVWEISWAKSSVEIFWLIFNIISTTSEYWNSVGDDLDLRSESDDDDNEECPILNDDESDNKERSGQVTPLKQAHIPEGRSEPSNFRPSFLPAIVRTSQYSVDDDSVTGALNSLTSLLRFTLLQSLTQVQILQRQPRRIWRSRKIQKQSPILSQKLIYATQWVVSDHPAFTFKHWHFFV